MWVVRPTGPWIRSTSPSSCAVADSATIHLDRRLAATDTLESALREIEDLPSVTAAGAKVVVLDYAVPSWQGLIYPTKKYYPTWLLPEGHPLLAAAVGSYQHLFGEPPVVGRWVFSTNGVAVMGMHGIPCIGFGPGDEIYAHMATEQIPVDQLVKAAAMRRFWTMLAHYHGQTWNGSELARSMGLSDKTVRGYLDILTGAFMIRQLQPWHENLGKRQVKAPNLYVRDSGLLHSLLTIEDRSTLLGHPRAGASWDASSWPPPVSRGGRARSSGPSARPCS